MAIADIYCDCMKLLFFELIQVAIGRRERLSHTPTEMEWRELYAMAEKQAVIGICFCGVQRFQRLGYDIPMDLYMKWLGMAAKIQQRNEVVNAQCVEVQKMMEKAGFRTYIMKGQGNSALYRVSYDDDNDNLCLLRQSGDIDIYLDGGFDKVNDFVQRTCPTNEINELEIHYHCLPDTEVEIHYRPFIMRNPFKNRKLQRFFVEEGEKCFENKIALPNGVGEIAAPTTTFNLVHQMVHIYHHLLIGGVGLRQLMDYYFVLRDASTKGKVLRQAQEPSFKVSGGSIVVAEPVEVQEVSKVVHDLGLDRFASALMWVIAHVFANDGFDPSTGSGQAKLTTGNDNENLYPWEPNEKDGKFLLNEILLSGNFGNYDERLPQHRNKWQSFWMLSVHNLRLFRFTYDDWFWGPLWRLYQFVWRKSKGFK